MRTGEKPSLNFSDCDWAAVLKLKATMAKGIAKPVQVLREIKKSVGECMNVSSFGLLK
jgi:hypothetical protein